MSAEVTAHQPDHASVVQLSATVPWLQILAWIEKYGLPLVVQVANVVLPLIIKDPNILKWVTWIETALLALAAGQPLPPLPA